MTIDLPVCSSDTTLEDRHEKQFDTILEDEGTGLIIYINHNTVTDNFQEVACLT